MPTKERISVPIEGIQQVGLYQDTPAFAIPPNAFSSLKNIRLSDGALRKIEGESSVISGFNNIQYICWWPALSLAPNDGYYVVVDRSVSDVDSISLVQASDNSRTNLTGTIAGTGKWQHTLFSGGHALVLNNGVDTPRYIIEPASGTPTASYELPGWESYRINSPIVDVTYDGLNPEFDLGFLADFTNLALDIVVSRSGTSVISGTVTSNGTDLSGVTVATETDTNTTSVTFNTADIQANDLITISLISNAGVLVTARVIRSFGNLLVAGGLQETTTSGTVLRDLPGVIRTSDVAPAGSIPANWNPFSIGVSTADEFILSTTSSVQDMAELQGTLMIYTNTSIHSLRPTGNTTTPFVSQVITESYGAQGIDSVIEVDGKHIVVGSNDIYVFPGHPGNIQSISDDKVRRTFFNDINESNDQNLFMLRNNARDEIWINYPSGSNTFADRSYIWNYRDQTWTFREISEMRSGCLVPQNGTNPNKLRPLFANQTTVYFADVDDEYSDVTGAAYESLLSREKFTITPEEDTEDVYTMSMLVEGDTSFDLSFVATNIPSNDIDFDNSTTTSRFNTTTQYKSDFKLNGRFISFEVKENGTNDWLIAGIQFTMSKGGTR